MKKKNKHLKIISCVLFMLYLVLLVWIILFKLQFRINDIGYTRSINLIPFHYSTSVGEQFHFKEVIDNILIFIPFGVLLSMLSSRMKLQNKVLIIFGTSFIFEMIQYILAIGSTDITDLITNMFGGIIGISLYALLLKILKDKQKTDTVISTLAGIVAVLFLVLMTVLLLSN
ncbi:VanZ family protein [Clostridioides sp. ZZV14-6154]|uniref:VanZ family protein n=1 Tax=unclassified Clostridioides TaxID=2635829 RepID=UPI001D104AC4|nr:VanZ family protein [Clostridioides sp. ZZV14-6154]MCC0669689.1 VanZ family protein [Clostridioides sp. ZZV14-6153]MCC0740134.1 VanZ family protein [Clostridioides sp. ZZV14-5902]